MLIANNRIEIVSFWKKKKKSALNLKSFGDQNSFGVNLFM